MTEPLCSDVVDDGTPLTPRCPSNETCPTAPDCTRCEDCADEAGIGAPLEDGTYELADVVLYNSACGSFNATTASGVLVVSGSILSLAWTRPIALGATAPGSAAYVYDRDGNELLLTEKCPQASEAVRVSYATDGGTIYFSSPLPGEVTFSAVFERR
jgi:hypothetical protein